MADTIASDTGLQAYCTTLLFIKTQSQHGRFTRLVAIIELSYFVEIQALTKAYIHGSDYRKQL